LSVGRKQTKLEEKKTSRDNINPSKNGNSKNELWEKEKLAKVCVSHRFFFRNGSKRPSLCIKMVHTALFIKIVFIGLLHHNHGSIKVAA
jgi:hypothetical protein